MNHHKKNLILPALGTALLLYAPYPALAAPISGTLIQTIITKSPPWPSGITSPDPSGLAYLNSTGRLLDCDGEVDEMPSLFTGVNLFEINLDGTLGPTHSTTNLSRTGFSNEPVGCAYDAASGNLFISDDDQRRVFQIRPGNDGALFTADDIRTFFNAPSVCNISDIDAEGVAYGGGALFIIDGLGSEVWRVTASADGIFDGVGESCTHFDTSASVTDPEGGEYDTDNPGHLFVVGKPGTLSYFTTLGTFVQTIDISAANSRKPSGLAAAPGSRGSNDPTPTIKNLYIVDRGVDNGIDPSENDGKIYEFSLTGSTTGNRPPTAGAGTDQIISLSAGTHTAETGLNGTVTDDGLPNPPGTVTTAWSKVSGPGTVTFGNAAAVDTTATFNAEGSYTLRLTADDDGAGANAPVFDEIKITVNPPPAIPAIYVSTVDGGTTTAATGGIAFGDEDILVYDTNAGTWALFFDGSDVGLGGSGVNIDAFHILADQSILLSFAADTTFPALNGLGTDVVVDDSDILRFLPTSIGSNTAGSFAWFFDGFDVGLTTAADDIDAIAFTPDGRLAVSTIDPAGVTFTPAVSGYTAADEDLLVFNDTSMGTATAGTWAPYFDGSDAGLSDAGSEDVNGAFIGGSTGEIYLTTVGAFSVPGASGGGDDIFKCVPGSTGSATACTYQFVWNGIGSGLPSAAILDGIQLGAGPLLQNTAPVLAHIGNKTVNVGNLLRFTASATDTDVPANTLTFSLADKPAGAVINAASGVFSWTPDATGSYSFTVKVCDNAIIPLCDQETITVTVNRCRKHKHFGNCR
ncbi:MAG: putative Ig domain-containing protein [Methylobacter sp.]